MVVCDLADSTALVERLGDQVAAELIRRHDRLVRDLIIQHDGQEIDKTDGFLVMFERPVNAVAFALAHQHALSGLAREASQPLTARTGVHFGEVMLWRNRDEDIAKGAKPIEVEGLVKPVAARLQSLAQPGQILISAVVHDITRRAASTLPREDGARIVWRGHGRYQFKGVPDPVPVFEVGEDGRAPLRAPAWTGKAHRETPIWRRPLALTAEFGLLAALVIGILWFAFRTEPAIAFVDRDWVVIGDLRNLTGDVVFDHSLTAAFRVGLEQSRYVNVVPDMQVRDALRRMERDPADTPVDRRIGAEIAKREGARALILPSIAEIGGRIRLTAEVVHPDTETTVYSEAIDSPGIQAVLPAMDSLLGRVRGRLGESLASIESASLPLEKVTTSNIEALKAYSLAMQALADSRGGEAIVLFEQALRMDDEFALAATALASIYYTVGQRGRAHALTEQAMVHVSRLTGREKLRAEALAALFDSPTGMREKWLLYSRMYPDDMAGPQNLGVVAYWYLNDLESAGEYFTAVSQSRHPRRGTSWLALGDVRLAQGQAAPAGDAYGMAREIGAVQLNLQPVHLPLVLRDAETADRVLAEEFTHEFPYFLVERELRRSAIEITRGRYGPARSAAMAAVTAADAEDLLTSRQRAHVATIVAAFAADDSDAMTLLRQFIETETSRADAAHREYDYSPLVHVTLASVLAHRHGDSRLALEALSRVAPLIESSDHHNLIHPLRAARCEIQARSNPVDAISCLEQLDAEPGAYYQTGVALLHVYSETDKSDQALALARRLANERGRAVAEWLFEYGAQTLNLHSADEALIIAAELEVAAGNSAQAASLLQPLSQAWSGFRRDAGTLPGRAAAVEETLSAVLDAENDQ